MPNMFGGDQFHPAYMPRELSDNEVMIGNIVYRLVGDVIEEEQLSGEVRKYPRTSNQLPKEVRDKFDR